jgi:hypothetical protein
MKYGEGGSEASVKSEGLVGAIDTDTRFGVFSDAFLKEICFALEADRLHPFERVPSFEVTVAAKAKEELVSTEFDVVAHHGGVHSDQFDGKGVNNEFHFDCNGAANDLDDSRFREPVD